jgi:hypothetical protein
MSIKVRPPDTAGIEFQRWRLAIQTACDFDQLMQAASGYLKSWTDHQLAMLPPDLRGRFLTSTQDLADLAVAASRAEIQFSSRGVDYPVLREMALTLAAAVSRLRYLESLREGRRG